MKKIFPLLIIFFASLYLLLVAIVATSHLDLQAKSPEGEFTDTKLDTVLRAATPQIDVPQYTEPQSPIRKAIPDLVKDIIAKAGKTPLKKKTGIVETSAGNFMDKLSDIDIRLSPAYTDIARKKIRFGTYMDQLKASAHLKFTSNAGGLSTKEKNGYFGQIATDFNKAVSDNTGYFSTTIADLELCSQQVAKATENQVAAWHGLSARLDTNMVLADSAALDVRSYDLSAIKIPTIGPAPFELDQKVAAIKDYDQNGYEWGWLGQASSWLIKPNSYDLILIVGMVGFGLFGAAISIFINKTQFDPKVSVFENIINTMIKGFAAAIVIFLATKGGIAILNTGTNKPNPYVLFITCLIGSVFSQPVWDWAKDYIDNAYKGSGGGGAKKGEQEEQQKQV